MHSIFFGLLLTRISLKIISRQGGISALNYYYHIYIRFDSLSECCQIKEFHTPITGKILRGHVIKTLFVAQEEMCRVHCYLDDICQSINISPRPGNGQWKCELNDVSDSENLVEAEGHQYYATKVSKISY